MSTRFEKLLQEGERAFGAYWYNATAKHYHGVNNFNGALDGIGPDLSNDRRLLEQHIQRLSTGRPMSNVLHDLLERNHPR
jgi:hypothetical protein